MPADVTAEARELLDRVQATMPADLDVTSALGLEELCPACHALVPLHDITKATCPNGHVWGMLSPLLPPCMESLICGPMTISFVSSSALLNHLVHSLDTDGPDMCGMQPESFPAAPARWACAKLATLRGA